MVNAGGDVGPYFDRLEAIWSELGLTAERRRDQPVFSYDEESGDPYTGGHILAHLVLEGYPGGYIDVDEWITSARGGIHRVSYVYELIYEGAILENWHRHASHGFDHTHRGEGPDQERIAAKITHEDAVRKAVEILWSAMVPSGHIP